MATADQLDSRCDIEIVGVALADNEPKMLQAVLTRVAHHIPRAKRISVYCSEPQPNGWLEWMIRITYQSGHALTIGCVRRTAGAEVEFHS